MSLHRAPPRGLRSPAKALLGFLANAGLGPGTDRSRAIAERGPSSVSIEWRWWFRARRSGRSMLPAACMRALSKPCPPHGSVPVARPLPSCGRRCGAPTPTRAPASGPRSPSGVPSDLEVGGCFPRVPLWGSLLRRPGAPVCSPGAILLRAFDALRPTARRTRHPGVLRTAESAGRFRLPTPLSFATD